MKELCTPLLFVDPVCMLFHEKKNQLAAVVPADADDGSELQTLTVRVHLFTIMTSDIRDPVFRFAFPTGLLSSHPPSLNDPCSNRS